MAFGHHHSKHVFSHTRIRRTCVCSRRSQMQHSREWQLPNQSVPTLVAKPPLGIWPVAEVLLVGSSSNTAIHCDHRLHLCVLNSVHTADANKCRVVCLSAVVASGWPQKLLTASVSIWRQMWRWRGRNGVLQYVLQHCFWIGRKV